MIRNLYFLLLLALFSFLPFYGFGQFNLVSDATNLGSGEYRLTPDAGGKKGAIWATSPIDLSKRVEISAKVFYGDGNSTATYGGADGLALVFQTVGITAIGSSGGGMGYQNGGASPHFAAELRTWRSDSISFQASNGARSTGSFLPPADNQYHDLRFVWDHHNKTSKVYFDGVLAASYIYDIPANIFGGQTMVTYGFTAGTGGSSAEHKVKDIVLSNPIPTMSEWGLIILALLLLNMGVLAMVMSGTAVTPSGAKFSLRSMSFPFDKKQYGLMLLIAGAGILSVFALAILGFGYEVTSADIPGSILALPLVAYLLHLVFRK